MVKLFIGVVRSAMESETSGKNEAADTNRAVLTELRALRDEATPIAGAGLHAVSSLAVQIGKDSCSATSGEVRHGSGGGFVSDVVGVRFTVSLH